MLLAGAYTKASCSSVTVYGVAPQYCCPLVFLCATATFLCDASLFFLFVVAFCMSLEMFLW